MSSNLKITLVAIVGRDGNIGPIDDDLKLPDEDTVLEMSKWFISMIEGSTVILGSNTWRRMIQTGFQDNIDGIKFMVWSRSLGTNPEEFLGSAKSLGKNIKIIGGAKTFEIFGPYVDIFILRRANIVSEKGHELPEFFKHRRLN